MSNASTATKGGSVAGGQTEKDEVRDFAALREIVAAAVWDDGGVPVPYERLMGFEREEWQNAATAAMRAVADRVLLPRIRRCLRAAQGGGVRADDKAARERAMVQAILYESIVTALTGESAAAVEARAKSGA